MVEKVTVTRSELEEAYKHNMTDMIRQVCDYFVRCHDRILLLQAEFPTVNVYCDDRFIFQVTVLGYIDSLVFSLKINYYVYFTADLIILPGEYVFGLYKFIADKACHEYKKEFKDKQFHIADIRYGGSVDAYYDDNSYLMLWQSGFDIVNRANDIIVGNADNLDPNTHNKVGFIHELSVTVYKEQSKLYDFKVRHTDIFTVFYRIEDQGETLDRLYDWIKDTDVDRKFNFAIIVPSHLLKDCKQYLTDEVIDGIIKLVNMFYLREKTPEQIFFTICNESYETKYYQDPVNSIDAYTDSLKYTIDSLKYESEKLWKKCWG